MLVTTSVVRAEMPKSFVMRARTEISVTLSEGDLSVNEVK